LQQQRLTAKEFTVTTSPELTVSLVAKLVAKNETADEVAAFLGGAVELANEEAGTIVWFALRTDETTFWIVDAFPSQVERQAHLDGPIASALMANAERLLAGPLEILPADVLSAKVP
jgi:quinol monooxygenase YgiN